MSIKTKGAAEAAERTKRQFAKGQRRSYRSRSDMADLGWLLLIFISLFVVITFLSHLFGLRFFAGEGDELKRTWGSVSDWFSGVAGISIGLAGSAIAIWLAYRVEKLTAAQNQLANTQSWRESYIDSGEINGRAEVATHAYNYMQTIYTNLLEIRTIDEVFTSERLCITDEKRMEGTDYKDDVQIAKKSHLSSVVPLQLNILEAFTGLVDLLPTARIRDGVEEVLGISPARIKEIARYYFEHVPDEEKDRAYRTAKRIKDSDDNEVDASSVIDFFMCHTKTGKATLGEAYSDNNEIRPTDFGEFVYAANEASVGEALREFDGYLPKTKFATYQVHCSANWMLALCDDILNYLNPYRFVAETLHGDFDGGNINEMQRDRLAASMHFIIANTLPQSRYIRDIFPEEGYEKKMAAELDVPTGNSHSSSSSENFEKLRKIRNERYKHMPKPRSRAAK